ncbi:CpsD/CapB family tyrosine-protein kinase [Paenibacillus sedimenti]|uniref:non-specific protein-tyrosine kinase n=1 Tax=Paenibacillus sedimenti TaxID=2770274 RepID=A0A926KL32_9BACL|nr:CpsD/CapB family tyrosine-protein kinase [Paenibacillus sedimenti]MBD0379774.1 CpsD/CapB family tyrosine-protein kinase [Paenibacillus sedimenti]
MSTSTNRKGIPLITNTNPKSFISEAYRTLRTNITFSSVDKEMRRILVTSSQPKEGKSTTVANLAVAYAQEGKKVLVIDGDLRKPTLHHYFLRSNRNGLTNILANQSSAKDVIVATDITNLSFLPSGPVPPNPSELLGSKKLSLLIEQFEKEYDLILFDSPPLLAVTDSQILSTLCDGVILVVHSGKVKRQLAKRSLQQLEYVKANVLGVVLNDKLNLKDGDTPYYYYYGTTDV